MKGNRLFNLREENYGTSEEKREKVELRRLMGTSALKKKGLGFDLG